MSTELDQALAALAEAKPTPEAVKQLAAATVARRETPYGSISQEIKRFGFRGHRNELVQIDYYTCSLCGAVLSIGERDAFNYWDKSAKPHLDWHNDQERRLRKLEEKEIA